MHLSLSFKVTLSTLLFLLQFAAAVDLVIKRDYEASAFFHDNGKNKGWNVYLGEAKWNNDPGFLTDDGALIALARDAFKRMRDQARDDNVPNPPNALAVMIYGRTAFMASSISKADKGQDYRPGDLLSLVKQPLYEQDTLNGPTPAFDKSYTLSVLGQCLRNDQDKDNDHEMICGEPMALHLFWERAGLPGQTRKNGLKGQPVKMVTWGTKDGREFVFAPCTGGRIMPDSLGCRDLLNYLSIPFVSSGTPGTYPPPDEARAPTLCVDKDEQSD
ncbi:MAG: hypothetical protein Q9160_008321 [Pyrenula sp. 1 TL-2023]